MAVGRVGRGQAVIHAQQRALAGREAVQPVLLEAVVRIDLKDQRALAVVAEKRVAVGFGPIGAAAVPALTVENKDAAGRRNQLVDMLHIHPFRRPGHAAPMRAGHNARAAVLGRETVQQPHRIDHHRRSHVQQVGANVAVQALHRIAGPHDARVQAAQNDLLAQHILDDGQRAGVIDKRVVKRVKNGQVADMAGLAQKPLLPAELGGPLRQRGPQSLHLRPAQHLFQQREAVNIHLPERLLQCFHPAVFLCDDPFSCGQGVNRSCPAWIPIRAQSDCPRSTARPPVQRPAGNVCRWRGESGWSGCPCWHASCTC